MMRFWQVGFLCFVRHWAAGKGMQRADLTFCLSLWSCPGPRHVVTAAHCVFDINASRQYVSSLNFAPGQSGASTQPYGSVDWASVRVLSQFTSQVSAG